MRRFRVGFFGLIILMNAVGSASEGTMETKVENYRLPNGLNVIVKAVPAAPVVSVFIWYRVGSRNEPAGQSGLAHFLEHMLFKGTAKFGKGEIARLVGRTGGQQNAFTSYDYTAYFETLPAEHLELALEIEADRMQHSLLLPAELQSERTVILSELEGNRNQPQTRLSDLVNAQAWVEHPYRRPVIGWRRDVERITPEQMRAFYRQYYRPDNATLVVVGDFDPARLQALIQRWFGPIPAGASASDIQLPREAQQGERRIRLKDFGQTAIVRMQTHIPPAGHPDHFAITVLNDALTSGKTSRLYRALVDKGLATQVNGSPMEMIDDGMWVFTAVCQQGVDPARVEAVMRREFDRAAREPLAPREFSQSVNQTRAHLIYARDSLTEQASILGYYQTVAGDWRLPDQYPQKVAAVTPSQIQAAAAGYLHPDQLTLGCFIPITGAAAPGAGVVSSQDVLPAFPRCPAEERLGDLPPAPGAAAEKTGAGFGSRYVLSNGLTLLIHANPANPTINLSGLVRAGMAMEPEQLPGLAFVHSRMLDRGTTKRTARQLAANLEFKAADLSYRVESEHLNISGEALAEDVELLLAAVMETLSQPVFPEAELEKVRKETLTFCKLLQDDSQSQAWRGFMDLAYPEGHPMRRNLMTAEAGVRRLARPDLQAFHRQWIRPDLTILSLSGDVDPGQLARLAEKLFSAWQASGPRPGTVLAPMPLVAEIRTWEKEIPGKRESMTVLGHEGIRRLDPEYYPVYVANHALGGSGLSSRLMQTVRDEAGLTYSIYSQFKLSRGVRPWVVSFQSDPEKVGEAVDMIWKEVRNIQSGGLREQLVDDVREELAGGLAMSLETNSGIAYLNREVEYHELGGDYVKAFSRAVRGVTRDQAIAAAAKWFHPDRYLLSSARPPRKELQGESSK